MAVGGTVEKVEAGDKRREHVTPQKYLVFFLYIIFLLYV